MAFIQNSNASNSLITPTGQNLANLNRTLSPVDGSLAYNETDQLLYYGKDFSWNLIANGVPTQPLNGDVTGPVNANVIVSVGGQSATSVANSVSNTTSATDLNTPATIVKRDAFGNFSAGTITANTFVGNLIGSILSAVNFTGSLSGDITGFQTATTVASVAGQSANNVALATGIALAATNLNTANAVVKRDINGNFSAGTITATLAGNSTNFTGSLVGDVTGTQSSTIVSMVGGQTSTAVASATVTTNTATPNNTPSAIVKRDGSGNFSAGTITASTFSGNLTGNVTGNATSSVSFSGSLVGDVTGTQSATVVASVGGQTSTNVASATVSTLAASDLNTASTIVKRDTSGNFSAGTISASLTGNVTGSASLNVLKAGDTMTGTLILPAGSSASPSLKFSGSTNTGISASVLNTLSFDTNALERVKIDGSGNVTINALNSHGVVHNDNTGLLSTSLIVNSDITNGTIATAKLASVSTSNTANTLVLRDNFGNFSTNQITITGSVTNSTDVATKNYVDSAISTGLVAKTPAVVLSTSNIVLTGLQTIDSVLLVATNRVLLTGQSTSTENGLWEAQAGAWTRPTDFNTGNTAGQAYVLISSGTINGGSSWLCNTPTAIIDTNPISFAQFSLPNQLTGVNIGAGIGQVFKNKVGNNLNFRSLLSGIHVNITNNADDITFSTDATDANTSSTLVSRDGSGNFSAGTITANLAGTASNNVLKSGDNMTGALTLPAGTVGAPSLNFTGSTTTGLSTVTDNLSFSTAALERMKISSSGTVSINSFSVAGVVHNNASGNLSSSLIVDADITVGTITDSKLATISTSGKVSNSATTATNLNTASTIVLRDASGDFSAGTITANTFSGNLSGTASNFSGSLSGDVTGTQSSTVVSLVGGQSASNVAAATVLANAATNLNTVSAIVKRDASGNFSAGTITANLTGNVTGNVTGNATTATTATNFSGSLSGNVTGTQSATVVSSVGGQSSANVAAATFLANAATNLNTASTIVKRDASGNFSAGTITATFSGNGSGITGLNINASNITGTLPVSNGGTGTVTGSITGTGALTFAAGGTNQNVNITPSGTGYTILNGNVGIGTTIPGYKLDVSGTSNFANTMNLPGTSVITSTGTVGIGTTSPSAPLHVAATSSQTVSGLFGYYLQGTYGINGATTTSSVSIIAAGSIVSSSGGFLATSDQRLKEDIQDISEEKMLTFLNKSRPVYFKWKDSKDNEYGFIAQDLIRLGLSEMINPIPDETNKHLVENIENDGFINPEGVKFTVNYNQLIALTTQAIKYVYNQHDQLVERVNSHDITLKETDKEIQALKKENSDIKTRLDQIERLFQSK